MKEKHEIYLATYEETIAFASYLAATRSISEIKDKFKKAKGLQVYYQDVAIYRTTEGFYYKIVNDYFMHSRTRGKEVGKITTYYFGKAPEYDGTETFGYANYRCCFYGLKIFPITQKEFEKKENAEIIFCTGYSLKNDESEVETPT